MNGLHGMAFFFFILLISGDFPHHQIETAGQLFSAGACVVSYVGAEIVRAIRGLRRL